MLVIFGTKEWQQGTIRRKCQEPRSHMVETESGGCLGRNRRHIQPATELVPGRHIQPATEFASERTVEAQAREEFGESDI